MAQVLQHRQLPKRVAGVWPAHCRHLHRAPAARAAAEQLDLEHPEDDAPCQSDRAKKKGPPSRRSVESTRQSSTAISSQLARAHNLEEGLLHSRRRRVVVAAVVVAVVVAVAPLLLLLPAAPAAAARRDEFHLRIEGQPSAAEPRRRLARSERGSSRAVSASAKLSCSETAADSAASCRLGYAAACNGGERGVGTAEKRRSPLPTLAAAAAAGARLQGAAPPLAPAAAGRSRRRPPRRRKRAAAATAAAARWEAAPPRPPRPARPPTMAPRGEAPKRRGWRRRRRWLAAARVPAHAASRRPQC